jgi:hypothetical protein
MEFIVLFSCFTPVYSEVCITAATLEEAEAMAEELPLPAPETFYLNTDNVWEKDIELNQVFEA